MLLKYSRTEFPVIETDLRREGGDFDEVQDVFLPKISRSDPEVRRKAVKEEINVELLKQVMNKDADPEVRNLARERLHAIRPELEIA